MNRLPDQPARARRILIVEDEFLLAFHLEDLLAALGHHVIGTASRIAEAVAFAQDRDFDFAILDINLAGGQSFPVADILRQRNIPFVFASGYGSAGLLGEYRQVSILRKPYELEDIKRAIAAAVSP